MVREYMEFRDNGLLYESLFPVGIKYHPDIYYDFESYMWRAILPNGELCQGDLRSMVRMFAGTDIIYRYEVAGEEKQARIFEAVVRDAVENGVIEKESESMDLFRYDGEMVSTTEGGLRFGIQSDKGVLAWDGDTYEVVSLDEESGSIQRRSPLTWRDFLLNVVVGKSYYGVVLGSQGEYLRAYISEENFWSGDKEKIVVFPDQ